MLDNRSIPRCTVIPELAYDNVGEAADWLCDVFGFTVRVRIADHRIQLNVRDGAMVVIERRPDDKGCSSVMVRIGDVYGHHEHAKAKGAHILRAPADYPYGERQYTVQDVGGHCWTFSQSIADVAPEEWGGTSGQL
ncbi:MAG TPA: VOC family protein [Terriglobales bacterium]|nr:VOC family protein [Terriglobales bacterium]